MEPLPFRSIIPRVVVVVVVVVVRRTGVWERIQVPTIALLDVPDR